MSDKPTSVEVRTSGPRYLAWRGQLLAELALARVPGLSVHKQSNGSGTVLPFDFLVATEHGFCFFVAVKAFSSLRLEIVDASVVRELRWAVDAELVRRAQASPNPVLLFLFDADSDHGRYLRLDTLPAPNPSIRKVTVGIPIDATITPDNLEWVINNLAGVVKP